MYYYLRALISVALLACGAPLMAQEVLVDCRFEFRPITPKQMERAKEKQAMEWFNSAEFSRHRFVLEMGSGSITDGPGAADLWKQPSVQITSQNVDVTWKFHSAPLDREPQIWIKVNRFTGEAMETYTMLNTSKRLPREAIWSRLGKCTLTKRQI